VQVILTSPEHLGHSSSLTSLSLLSLKAICVRVFPVIMAYTSFLDGCKKKKKTLFYFISFLSSFLSLSCFLYTLSFVLFFSMDATTSCLESKGSIYLSIYLSIYGSTASSFIYSQSIGLLLQGISPSQGLTLHTEQHKHRIKAHRQPPLKWDSNSRSQCSSRRRRFMP
jgi:hypothetical protein